MCDPREPVSVASALVMLDRALDVLAHADAAGLPASTQAEALRALERAEARHTAARARMLTAFSAQAGYEDDGQGSARVWLRWQTRVTKGAAAGAVAWMRRLAAHPVIGKALAAGEVSASWAREICAWSDRLPGHVREDADAILVAAARGGAEEPDLRRLAEEMYERSRRDSADDEGGDRFDDRALGLASTLGGAGRVNGDLPPGCCAALSAVLEALARKAGPEDTRTAAQRRHDALEEACRRLIAAGMVPGRAGQARQIMVPINLAQLRATQGASGTERAWAAQTAGRAGGLTGAEAAAAACDATLVPVVTGYVDPAALDGLVEAFLTGDDLPVGHQPSAGHEPASAEGARPGRPGRAAACGCVCGGCTCPARTPLPARTRTRLRGALLGLAADALSGARPGARREVLESYVKRLEDLEQIAKSFKGVEKCFAVQAGREMRIIVEPGQVSDDDATMLARDVAKKIETDMTYPGQIRVTVIRETRATELAR